MSIDNKIWEKQDYETDYQYGCFQVFLACPTPRDLEKAHSTFHMQKHGKTPEEVKHLNLPKTWKYWSVGKDSYNNKIKNAFSWYERASEYDNYIASESGIEDARNRDELVTKEQEDFKSMVDAWTVIFEQFKSTAQKTKNSSDISQKVRQLKDLISMREDISDLGRKAYRLPTKIEDIPDSTPFQVVYDEGMGAIHGNVPIEELDEDEIGEGFDELKEAYEKDNNNKNTQNTKASQGRSKSNSSSSS